jgi:hypothetical protein
VFSEILQTPQEYKEVAYWADAIGPYITRVFNRDGTLFSQMSGGAGMLSGDGLLLYLHGIHVQVDPDNDIWKFRHGIFRVDGTEVWTQTIESVGGFPERFKWYDANISDSGNLLARECSGYVLNGVKPENCPAPRANGIIAYDGLSGTMLYTKPVGFDITVSVSKSGNYVLVENPENMRTIDVCGRDGSITLSKDVGSGIRLPRMSNDDSRIAVATDTSLVWLTLQGEILWTLPISAYNIQISLDGRVINALYQEKIGNSYYDRSSIISAETGQVLHTFASPVFLTSDGTKALVYSPRGAYIELWDITPLFP